MQSSRVKSRDPKDNVGSIMIAISLGIQILWPALDASARAVDARLTGQVFEFFGAAVTVRAWMTMNGATRNAAQ